MNCTLCPAFEQSVFRDLGSLELATLERHKKERFIERGAELFGTSDSAQSFYCNRSSFFKIGQRAPSGEQEVIVRLAPPGDCLGHRSVFHRRTYLGRAQALQEGVVCELPRSALQDLLATSPPLARRLLEKLSQEISDCEERLQLGHQHSVRQRLASLLLRLGRSIGETAEGPEAVTLRLPLTRRDLAALIPTSMETVVRELSQLKREAALVEESEQTFRLSMSKLHDILATEKT